MWARKAKERFDAGDFQGAIDGIREAEKHARAPTLTRISAQAHERLGKLLEAQRLYRSIVETQLAPDAPSAWVKAQAGARDELASITLRIPRLEITVTGAEVAGVSVTIDGAPFDAARLGAPVPQDPGARAIVVRAPGRDVVSRTVELREGRTERIQIRLSAPVGPVVSPTPSVAAPRSDRAVPRALGWVTVGVGAAGLIAGGITGGLVLGQRGTLDGSCNFDLGLCTEGSRAGVEQLKLLADVSTVSFIAGGVVAAAGVVLLLLPGPAAPAAGRSAPSRGTVAESSGAGLLGTAGDVRRSSPSTLRVAVSPSGLTVRGEF